MAKKKMTDVEKSIFEESEKINTVKAKVKYGQMPSLSLRHCPNFLRFISFLPMQRAVSRCLRSHLQRFS